MDKKLTVRTRIYIVTGNSIYGTLLELRKMGRGRRAQWKFALSSMHPLPNSNVKIL